VIQFITGVFHIKVELLCSAHYRIDLVDQFKCFLFLVFYPEKFISSVSFID
jgi:hypothetical protein